MDTPVLANQQKHQLCADTECYQEDFTRVMTDRDKW